MFIDRKDESFWRRRPSPFLKNLWNKPTTTVLSISPLTQTVACLETERDQKKRNRVQQNWMIKVRQAAMPAKKLGQEPSNKKILKYSHCHTKQFHPSSASNKAIAIFLPKTKRNCLPQNFFLIFLILLQESNCLPQQLLVFIFIFSPKRQVAPYLKPSPASPKIFWFCLKIRHYQLQN